MVSARLAEARAKAGKYLTLEQLATLLMLLYELNARLVRSANTSVVIVDVCMLGAPWRTPESIEAKFNDTLKLSRMCCGGHDDFPLQGKAPCGKSWPGVNSP